MQVFSFWLAVLDSDRELPIIWLGLAGLLIFFGGGFVLPFARSLVTRFVSLQAKEAYQKVVNPYEGWLGIAIILLLTDLGFILLPDRNWLRVIELPIGLALTIAAGWVTSRIFRQFFDIYLLEFAVKSGRKLNTELLILTRLLADGIIVVVAIILFAQTHHINIFGLVASLGVGGLAVAFAAQSTLQQIIGGIVIYLDRPFAVDDYIGLPDGTFGRVESIGLRSTKIRTSGKGTLMIVPNSSLTQINIENFTGAKKVMAIIYFNFYRAIKSEERALISQVILESTVSIFGIDTRSTDVIFKDLPDKIGTNGKGKEHPTHTQAQVTFFILGSGEVSMELRRQFLDLATQSITQQLTEYGIGFDVSEPTIYVDSPITI